jgi:branched-chain amino acid transport system substrate-binding protein
MKNLIASLLLITALVSLSCERKGGGNREEDATTIRVGVYGDLSGQTASYGQSTANGVRIAADEINAAGGVIGKKIELLIEDDQGRPEQAATVVAKLISQNQVHAVLGEVASSNSLAAAPRAQQAKIPMISPASTNPKVTQVGDYIFRVCFIDPFQGEVMAKFAANSLKVKTAAIMLDVNSDYSRGLRQFFTESFQKAGGRIVQEQSYTQTDRDFKGQLTAIRAVNPDIIYIPGYYSQVGVIAKQARELGIKVPLLGGDGWDAPQLWELGGQALNNTFISNHYSVEDPKPEIQRFVAEYRKRHGAVPDAMAALAYDAMKVLADAIKRAGTTESAKLRDAIAATNSFPAVTGLITINAERNAIKPAVVLELKDGKYHYRDTIEPERGAVTITSPTETLPTPPPPPATPAGT